MNFKGKINNIREIPKEFNLQYEFIFSTSALFLGLILGFLFKALDSISIIGTIGSELPIWIFIATLIASYSSAPLLSMINVPLFFLGTLCTYYLYSYINLGFFPRNYFLIWLGISLLVAPLGSFIAWFSKGKGNFAILITSMPIAILFLYGYAAFYTEKINLYFSLILGLILNFLLPKTTKMKVITFGLALFITFLIIFLI